MHQEGNTAIKHAVTRPAAMISVSRTFKPAHSRHTRTCQCYCVVVMTPYQLTKHGHKYICDLRLILWLDVNWGSERLQSRAAGADSTISRLNDDAGLCGWCTLLGSYHRYILIPQFSYRHPCTSTLSAAHTLETRLNGDCTVIWHVWKVCLGPAVFNPAAPQPNNSEQRRACSTSEPTSSRWSCPLVTEEWVS